MFKREDRLKELFLREVTAALRGVNGLNSGGTGILTITGVDLTSDAKDLSVYYSVIGTPQQKERCERILKASIRDIRQSLKKRLRLRVIPNLVFKFDSTPEYAAHIEDLFTRIKSEKNDAHENP
jgi:ribosome-binding factor A